MRVTATKTGYSSIAKTSAVKGIPLQSLTVASAPMIARSGAVGQTLTAKTGAWSPAPVTLNYQWLRNGAPISGATKSTYKLTAADKGKNITVKVTGSKSGYTSLSKTSAAKPVK
ncbi:hypothetical protein [Pseudoclavibacter sp. RFBB5]|uniref:hypothetical protein n=1 Tax=Pseudoclavibacter sp. RFBB5 TaxID=2080574 RepID=UPI0011B0C488|nr:hypothetical protein [Pseudoclavibacter sp. RFBB5]